MARLPRYTVPGQPQHIIQRGNNRQTIFIDKEDYQFYSDALVDASAKYDLAIHAYVWMSNHIHLLATPGALDSVSKVFQSLGRRYVQYFNFKHKRSGTLWEGRYRATVIDSERYLLTVMRYIEMNPVRAGMVKRPGDYAWSSHAHNAGMETPVKTEWLTPQREYLRLGRTAQERQQAYRQLFRTVLPKDDLKAIRDSTHKGWALGGERFIKKIEVLGQRRATSKGIGRPKILEP